MLWLQNFTSHPSIQKLKNTHCFNTFIECSYISSKQSETEFRITN